MIVVEKRMVELFSLLPLISVRKPVYHFGDGKELNRFILESKYAVYPLIYQTSYRETQLPNQGEVQVPQLEMFIAVQTRTDMFNKERWATSYQNILMPTFEHIHQAFIKSGIVNSEWEYDVEKFPNYGNPEVNGTENVSVDIIDALRFRLSCTINNKCIKPFKFT